MHSPRIIVVATVAFVLAATSMTFADGVSDFYRANGLTVVVGRAPGSSYDLAARLVAKYLAKTLPGKPNVIVKNMPGAGSLLAANYIYNQAPKDGSHIGLFDGGLTSQPLLDPKGVRFDPVKLAWVGNAAQEVSIVFAWHTTPFHSIDDVRQKEMVVPGTGGSANSVVYPRLLNGLLGTRFKLVSGYRGASETMLAIERGEAQGHAGASLDSVEVSRPDWIKQGKARVLLQMGRVQHPSLANVPMITDVKMSPADRQALDMVLVRHILARPVAAPPETPADRLDVLRRAFDLAMADPEFVAEAQRQAIDVAPAGAREIEQRIRDLYAIQPDVVDRVRKLIGTRDNQETSKE
jgi:tripartite-type tricarboxylate transporter receptor subunit TctC